MEEKWYDQNIKVLSYNYFSLLISYTNIANIDLNDSIWQIDSVE